MRAKLIAELALWTSRRTFRYRKWRGYVKRKPAGDPLREKWFMLYKSAAHEVRRVRHKLSRLPVTTLDRAGLDLIRHEEGVRREPYNDSAGHCTVGVGHLIHRGYCTAADVTRWTLTDREVDELLRRDLRRFERAVRKAFIGKTALKATQPRFNALVSLAFNIGEGGFASSTVKRCIREGRRLAAADAILMWDNPPELRPRRERERKLFLS